MTRVFDAPRERVFQAYTDPRLYGEVVPPERLVSTFAFEGMLSAGAEEGAIETRERLARLLA